MDKRDLTDMLGDITPFSATHKDVSDLPDHSMIDEESSPSNDDDDEGFVV